MCTLKLVSLKCQLQEMNENLSIYIYINGSGITFQLNYCFSEKKETKWMVPVPPVSSSCLTLIFGEHETRNSLILKIKQFYWHIFDVRTCHLMIHSTRKTFCVLEFSNQWIRLSISTPPPIFCDNKKNQFVSLFNDSIFKKQKNQTFFLNRFIDKWLEYTTRDNRISNRR